MVRLDSVSISAGPIKASFKPTSEERDAAWMIMVDLGTSIATQPFLEDSGHIRDVLSSLHRTFTTTKETMRGLRPSTFDGDMNFAAVCMALLTQILGPFLARWHEPLVDYEAERPSDVSELSHEKHWAHRDSFLSEFKSLQTTMLAFTQLLSDLSGVALRAD